MLAIYGHFLATQIALQSRGEAIASDSYRGRGIEGSNRIGKHQLIQRSTNPRKITSLTCNEKERKNREMLAFIAGR